MNESNLSPKFISNLVNISKNLSSYFLGFTVLCFSGNFFLIFPLTFFVYDLMNDVETVFRYILLLTYCKFGNFHTSYFNKTLRMRSFAKIAKKKLLSFTDLGIVRSVKRDWAVLSKDTPVDMSI